MTPDDAKACLLALLRSDEWELSERARREGTSALRWIHDRDPTDYDMVKYVITLLEADAVLRCAPQGDPPGSTGIAWQMTDSHNVFIKLQIREYRMGHEYAYLQSIHTSVHKK